MGFLTNNSSLMMEKSMNFLWAKQAAILDNIANAEITINKISIRILFKISHNRIPFRMYL